MPQSTSDIELNSEIRRPMTANDWGLVMNNEEIFERIRRREEFHTEDVYSMWVPAATLARSLYAIRSGSSYGYEWFLFVWSNETQQWYERAVEMRDIVPPAIAKIQTPFISDRIALIRPALGETTIIPHQDMYDLVNAGSYSAWVTNRLIGGNNG